MSRNTINPIFERRKLRKEVRRLRELVGLTQQDVADAMDWSLSKVVRIENGAVKISTTDLKALLQHYGVTDPERVESILATAKASRLPPWWAEFRDLVTPKFAQQLEYESSASELYVAYNTVVPGLLQTRDYARAVISNFQPHASVSRLVDLRMRRPQIFDREDPPEANFILGEAALRIQVGGRHVLREQLEHLLALMARDRISIEIIPFEAGAHPGMIGPFELMLFDDGEGDVASFESPNAFTIIREEPGIVSEYRETFESLRNIAVKDGVAEELIKGIIGSLAN